VQALRLCRNAHRRSGISPCPEGQRIVGSSHELIVRAVRAAAGRAMAHAFR